MRTWENSGVVRDGERGAARDFIGSDLLQDGGVAIRRQPAERRTEVGLGFEIDAGFDGIGAEIPEEEEEQARGIGDVARAGIGGDDELAAAKESVEGAQGELAGED